MALNPSCKGAGFPVLGDPPFREVGKDKAIREVLAAGIPHECIHLHQHAEVFAPDSEAAQLPPGIYVTAVAARSKTIFIPVWRVAARAYGWEFGRAWYYWYARSSVAPIPESLAHTLNQEWGKKLRVNGCAGGEDVTGPVGSYHIDSPEALIVLVSTIRSLSQREK